MSIMNQIKFLKKWKSFTLFSHSWDSVQFNFMCVAQNHNHCRADGLRIGNRWEIFPWNGWELEWTPYRDFSWRTDWAMTSGNMLVGFWKPVTATFTNTKGPVIPLANTKTKQEDNDSDPVLDPLQLDFPWKAGLWSISFLQNQSLLWHK